MFVDLSGIVGLLAARPPFVGGDPTPHIGVGRSKVVWVDKSGNHHDECDPELSGEDAMTFRAMHDSERRAVERGKPRDERPGRNEPCSCGSGKKYKRCCL